MKKKVMIGICVLLAQEHFVIFSVCIDIRQAQI